MNVALRALIGSTHYPTLGIVWLRCAVGFQNWYNWIDDSVALGARPTRRLLNELAGNGIRAIVNLCDEFPGRAAELDRLGLIQLHLPTVDYTAPAEADLKRGLNFIDAQVAEGNKVYLHCKAGNGRAATLALCYLMATNSWSAEQAQARLAEIRPSVMRRLFRRSCVRRLEAALNPDSRRAASQPPQLPDLPTACVASRPRPVADQRN